jgi:hypothetical protein
MKLLKKLSKLPTEYYIVIFLFLVVIFMCTSNRPVGLPYIGAPKSLNMYNYENFEGQQISQPVHSAANVSGKESSILEETKGVLGVFEVEGLKASPVDAPPLFDPVSKLKGSPDCTGKDKTNGYSNSLGGLCFTEEVNALFRARGSSPIA